MIGSLLKELWTALGTFIRHHVSRPFERQKSPPDDSSESVPAVLPRVGLDPVYEQTITWRTDRSDVSALGIASNPIHQLWLEMPQGQKWTHYFDIYRTIFESRRGGPMRILEIGVLGGASLRLWKGYFLNPKTAVVGVDIDPACARFDAPDDGIHVRIGSQADGEFLARIVAEFGPFDLIIDDGSHHSTHIITSFNCLYGAGLADDGIYFVEDLHANYHLPWRDSANSFLDFCKDLVELMHAHYRNSPLAAWGVELQTGASLTIEVPEITTMIREIRFFDSIVAIYKTRRTYVPRYIMA